MDTAHFEDLEHNNPTRLTAITSKLDDLCQQVQAEEGQPSEALNCRNCLYHSTHQHPLNPLER